MKGLIISLVLIFYCGSPLFAKDKILSVLEILSLGTEDALNGEAYENILKEKHPEEKLKNLLLTIPILFDRFDVYGNLQFGQVMGTLYEYSKKNKLSNEFAPILIDSLTRHLMMDTTLDNAKMLKKITKIDVGWDKNYIKKFKGTKEDYADRTKKIDQWKKWVIDNNVRDLVTNRLPPLPSKKKPINITEILKLENLDEIAQAFTDLAFDNDAENKIFEIIGQIHQNKFDEFKGDIFQFYAIEALELYSQNHSISLTRVPVLINCLKKTYIYKVSIKNANLIKKITKLDVGWEENFHKGIADPLHKEDPRVKMIKQWEEWVSKNNIK